MTSTLPAPEAPDTADIEYASRDEITALQIERTKNTLRHVYYNVPHYRNAFDDLGVHHPCGVELDYDTPLLDNSAETDHIVEYRYGGTDEPANLRVLCRRQNRERGHQRVLVPVAAADDFPVSQSW